MLPSLPTSLGEVVTRTIAAHDVDRHRRATLPALVNYLNDAAMQNVLRLRLSVWDLAPRGISWVLLKHRFTLRRLPELGETITIMTYPAGFQRSFTYRDYRVFDAQGVEIAHCASQWLLLDLNSRQLTTIPEDILAHRSDLPAAKDCLPRNFSRIVCPSEYVTRHQHAVRYFDLDWNEHLNNGVFIRWLLEALDSDLLSRGAPRTLEIHYKKEARLGQVLTSQLGRGEQPFYHQLSFADGTVAAVARSEWSKEGSNQ